MPAIVQFLAIIALVLYIGMSHLYERRNDLPGLILAALLIIVTALVWFLPLRG